MDKKIYVTPETCISNPITFNTDTCIGCNRCMEVCQVDLFITNPEKGSPPIIVYPSECWYCGCCVDACPVPGTIILNPLLMNRVHWKLKENQ